MIEVSISRAEDLSEVGTAKPDHLIFAHVSTLKEETKS